MAPLARHLVVLACIVSSSLALQGTLYDLPVSNHGARVRMILRQKGIDTVKIEGPQTLGGLKSDEYLALNAQGKMPLFVTSAGLPIPESATIASFVIDSTLTTPPTFIPTTGEGRVLSDLITRLHDSYITPIQGCLYRASGTGFGRHGDDRVAAMNDVCFQLGVIGKTLDKFRSQHPELNKKAYLTGSEPSLADVSLFPTLCFTEFMFPLFDCVATTTAPYLPSNLQAFYDFMLTTSEGKAVKDEIWKALEKWEANGRWDPILEEMASLQQA
mmetsp:Transcript_25653/g.51233  ORF Transcript_25653/g.51233 Transcript_25653/m.51233 type:complete len:272 (+) Transcript_25653:116-931(+)